MKLKSKKMKNSVENSQFSSREYGQILGVKVNSTHLGGLLRYILSERRFFIASINPEIVIQAQKDPSFRKTLNLAHVGLNDGVGISAALYFLSSETPKNKFLSFFRLIFLGGKIFFGIILQKTWLYSQYPVIKGRDLFLEIIKLANRKRWKVFLLGGADDAALKTKEFLEKTFKSVKIEFHQGPKLDKNAEPASGRDIAIQIDAVNKINEFEPEVLFVAFGAPKQEKWVFKWAPRLKTRGIVTVGGTFNYFSGISKLPPKWMEKAGLEWVWRLVSEPWRLPRILRAGVVFPLRVFVHKLNEK